MTERAFERTSDCESGPFAIARQPILDRAGSLCGYELLYRPLPVSGEGPSDPEAASASVIVTALAEIGLERLVADQPAYINVTRQLLVDLSLDDRLAAALLRRRGPEGRLLAAVEAYEHGNFDAINHHRITLPLIAHAYLDTLRWTDQTTTTLVA
jgi:c-di-GMP-related signal transduction protein